MSQYYQTTQGTTQYQLANIIAQGSSQTIKGYYNIQYIPAANTDFETQATTTYYNYMQGGSTIDVTNGSSVYYKDFTSASKITLDGTYNKCSIVACSGGGGGGGGGGAGFDGASNNQATGGNYKSGGNGGWGGQGVVAVYKDISLTPYQYITVNINSAGVRGTGGQSTSDGRSEQQKTTASGNGGGAGQDGAYVILTGTTSSGTSQLLTVNGGNGGQGGQGGENSDGNDGENGNDGSVTANVGDSNTTKSFTGSLTVDTNSNQCKYQKTNYGTNGNGGSGDTSSGYSNGGNGNSGNGAFARIYFYK
jgi:hypothetical protein